MTEEEPEFVGNQVVTELDLHLAICDFIAAQLEGRFRLQFPNHTEISEHMVSKLREPTVRVSVDSIRGNLWNTVSQMGSALTSCSLSGCSRDYNHAYMREFINLVWDAREQTQEWLRRQGIVPGQSAN